MRLHPFQAVYPNFDYITSPDSFFGAVKELYREYKNSGFFYKSPHEGFYIYEIRSQHRSYTGLLACTEIDDYLEGRIKKHENTLAAKEQQQMHLMLQRGAMVKPVLLFYDTVDDIQAIINSYKKEHEPFFESHFDEENEDHIFWEITDGALLAKLQHLFKEKVGYSYIADGHHRSSTTALLHQRRKGKEDGERYNWLLCALFPSSELEVHDYNRVVEALEEITMTKLMARLSKVFEIDVLNEPAKPSRKHELVMYINHEWYRLRWKQEVLDAHASDDVVLDASLLDKYIYKEILEIDDIRFDDQIKYVEGRQGIAGFKSRILKSDHRIGFMLYPVALEDVKLISDKGEIMPPKSTWFEPRMRNGLIVYELE